MGIALSILILCFISFIIGFIVGFDFKTDIIKK